MTTAAFENMTDEELSAEVAKRITGWRRSHLVWDVPVKGSEGMYEARKVDPIYATSLDACREAIEKFCDSQLYAVAIHRSCGNWIVTAYHTTSSNRGKGIKHQNPARAAAICMLKALEKEC